MTADELAREVDTTLFLARLEKNRKRKLDRGGTMKIDPQEYPALALATHSFSMPREERVRIRDIYRQRWKDVAFSEATAAELEQFVADQKAQVLEAAVTDLGDDQGFIVTADLSALARAIRKFQCSA